MSNVNAEQEIVDDKTGKRKFPRGAETETQRFQSRRDVITDVVSC